MSNKDKSNLLAEGKTKRIWGTDDWRVIVESKDDITAGDGAKHDVIIGKAGLANTTTSNVFHLLRACGIPVAFERQYSETEFIARKCNMIPYEVVVRRAAHGSFLKRHPNLKKGHVFPKLVLEFFLKTSQRKWQDHDLLVDDPLVVFQENQMLLYRPDVPISQQDSFLNLSDFPLKNCQLSVNQSAFCEIGEIALYTFLVLEKAWQILGRQLVDFKVEFGFSVGGGLVLADVIDNDSWRVIENGAHIDKQVYRDGGDINEVTAMYRLVAELTSRFVLPNQRIISFDVTQCYPPRFSNTAFEQATRKFLSGARVCHSIKESARACSEVSQLINEIPDSVVIVFADRHSGMAEILSSQVSVPVISVLTSPNKDYCLELPKQTPVATLLDADNARLLAFQMFAMRNPGIYAGLRMIQERNLCNVVEV